MRIGTNSLREISFDLVHLCNHTEALDASQSKQRQNHATRPGARRRPSAACPTAYTRLHSALHLGRARALQHRPGLLRALGSAAGCYQKDSYSALIPRGLAGTFYTYAQLQEQANRLSNALAQQGVQRGDRVAIVMPQCFETAVAYMAVLQMGAVAMPLSLLFGPDALEYRLQDSEAVLAIADARRAGGPAGARASTARSCAPWWAWAMPDAVQGLADCELADALAQFSTQLHAGGHAGRRPRHPDLHQRHHRQPQGRAAGAPRA